MDTCRSLQSLLAAPVMAPISTEPLAPAPSPTSLPTPPLTHAPSPMKLRLRQRPTAPTKDAEAILQPRRKITKRTSRPVPRTPTRGANKRRRSHEDDVGRDEETNHEDVSSDIETDSRCPAAEEAPAPSTPKRSRIAPEQLPLGLARSDFHEVDLLRTPNPVEANKPGTEAEVEADGQVWSAEDDRVLVELVLEKLNLTKKEWQECARNLGRDRHSVNKRWKSLMAHGDVGLKPRGAGRAKLHSTWR